MSKTSEIANRAFRWKEICTEYVREFIARHGYSKDWDWVGNDPASVGTIVNIGDMFINMEDIRFDIDNNVPIDHFDKWYWESVDRYEAKIKYMNYQSFCKGCPDPVPPTKMEEIKAARKRVAEARSLLQKEIDEYNTSKGNYGTGRGDWNDAFML